jgi:hypothetical protein
MIFSAQLSPATERRIYHRDTEVTEKMKKRKLMTPV